MEREREEEKRKVEIESCRKTKLREEERGRFI